MIFHILQMKVQIWAKLSVLFIHIHPCFLGFFLPYLISSYHILLIFHMNLLYFRLIPQLILLYFKLGCLYEPSLLPLYFFEKTSLPPPDFPCESCFSQPAKYFASNPQSRINSWQIHSVDK